LRNYDGVDFYTDEELHQDPHEYYDYLHGKGTVVALDASGVVAISGYEETLEVYRDHETFSACNTTSGPFAPFPVPLEGDDLTALIEEHRHHLPGYKDMVTMDPPAHTRERALLMGLITPKRLKENESFMWRLADQVLDEFIGTGRCEFIKQYSQPFAMLVIADLLGVPEEDHQTFRESQGLGGGAEQMGIGRIGGEAVDYQNAPSRLEDWFTMYIEDRRREPRKDVMTELALASYPDGSVPEVDAVVQTASFLFAAGQETSARLLGAAIKFLCEDPELQDELREHRERIPEFIEETLRLESPVKADHRLTKRAACVAGVDIAPGTTVMLLNGAANRDPRNFECPHDLRIDRENGRHHVAFGHGAHTCPGAPLARAEGRISIEHLLRRVRDIRLSEEHHGPASSASFEYEPTWILRGLKDLHVEFTPIDAPS
jgi:cytochrome P450